MSRPIFSKNQTIAALYDFNEFGGAVSSFGLSSFIPRNSIITRCIVRTFATIAAGVGCTISIDRIVGAVTTGGFFVPVTPFANFTAVSPNESFLGFDFNATPLVCNPNTDSEIGITIAGAAISAGMFEVIVNFQQTDILQ